MIKRHSTKRAAQERRLRKIEAELEAEGQTHCFFFPFKSKSCFDHIVPKSANTFLIDVEENIIPICNEAHYIITNGTGYQMQKLPRLREYLHRMKALDESYYRRFMTNHGLWDKYGDDEDFSQLQHPDSEEGVV